MDIQQISDVVSKIPQELPSWAAWALPFVVEVILRVVPTAKPKSLLLAIAAGGHLVAGGLEKASSLLDKVVQVLKDDPAP